MSGWRSSSSRIPERTIPWSSAISTLIAAFSPMGRIRSGIGPSSGGDGEADRGAGAGAGLDRQLAADQQGPLAHAGDAEAALGLVEGEAAAVVGDVELDAAVLACGAAAPRPARRRCGGRRWRAPPGRPGRRRAGRRRRGRRSRPRPRGSASISPRPSCSTWPAIAAARPRSSSAVGRSWRASESSSRIAWLASALVSASSASSSGGAASRAASSRSSSPVSDWLTSSWRSRATRARSSSWACSAAEPARRRSASSRRIIRRKASSIRSTSSVSPTPSIEAGRSGPGPAEVDLLHLLDQASSGAQRRRCSDQRERQRRGRPSGQPTHAATIAAAPRAFDQHLGRVRCARQA